MLKREARRRSLAMGSIIFLAACLFAIAFVHAGLVQDQQRLDDINTEIALGNERVAQLERDIMVASAPVAIVERAKVLGMVRAQYPEFLVASRYVAARSIFGQPATAVQPVEVGTEAEEIGQ